MSKRTKPEPRDETNAEKKPPRPKWTPPRVPPPDSDIWPEEYRGKNWKSVFAVLFAGKCQLCAYSCPLSKWRQGEDKFHGEPRRAAPCRGHPARVYRARPALAPPTPRHHPRKPNHPPAILTPQVAIAN